MAHGMPDQETQPQGGGSELASFGEELRREREIRGISLKEISDATKISKRFLEAIENNDHRNLPAPVFTRGFVREYARYVGLNAEEMVNRYNFAASQDDRIEKPPQIEKYPQTPVRDITPKPKPKRGIPPAYARVNRNAIALVVIVVALAAVAYWSVKQKIVERELEGEPALSTMVATKPAAVPVAPAPTPPPADTKLALTIEARERCWIDLDADGQTVFKEVIAAGASKTFEANERFVFSDIGNPAGIILRLNGIEIPPFGDSDPVHDYVLDKAALESLRVEEHRQP